MKTDIQLNCGIKIRLDEIYQYHTYSGLLNGYTNHIFNKKYIEEAQDLAKVKLWSGHSPFLIQPVETPINAPERVLQNPLYQEYPPSKLPAVACLASFISFSVKNDDEHASCLNFVWFQDQFAFPIEESVEEQIKKIDWHLYAKDFTY